MQAVPDGQDFVLLIKLHLQAAGTFQLKDGAGMLIYTLI